ncbi:MAG TPA: phosphatase PAP2 family protein [Longimicrobiales bacterium]|nr:phosphatase PAP2 family protein [Longimicrobiales bacterium]
MPDRGARTDRILAGYALIAGAALAFPHRPGTWPLLAAGHIAVCALALQVARIRPGLERPGARRWVRVLADWYPLLVIPLLYSELDLLNAAVWDGRYFDATILEIEQWLFGGQPSMTLARSAPWPALSEPLMVAYLSYYPIIYVPPLILYLRGDRPGFRTMLAPLVLAFLLHYLVFIYFPVQGPRYLFPAPGGSVGEGPLFRLAKDILDAGSSRGAAFPSSHMAVAVAQTVAAFRLLPRSGPLLVVATVGLGVGAVYGGFHYATDMIAGTLTGLAVALPFLVLDRRAGRR